MTSQYRCETCKNEGCDNHLKQVEFYEQYGNVIAGIIRDNQRLFSEYGCASHSDFQSEREKVLDEATELLFEQFKKFTNEKYIFGTDLLADWWIERVGYLRTPEGQAELRKQGEP
jgi:hypothetical protein